MKSSLKRAALFCRNRKGIALITVVTLLALATALLLALFSTTQTELKATAALASGANARQAADIAVNLVIGQLQTATRQEDSINGREIWTSQPGMVRQYRENGRLNKAFKLYSSNQMIIKSASDTDNAEGIALLTIMNDLPPTSGVRGAWDSVDNKSIWVDINEPVIQDEQLLFPVIDPRAYGGDTAAGIEKSVEGFSYTTKVDGTASGAELSGVTLPAAASDANDQRLPLPVQWLYMLQDGTIGYMSAATGLFVGAGGESATVENPIVSRVAFWTDDESCKININTAGEGTPWDTPRLYSDRDGDWARFQPMIYEYQRYPGHPATVSMSTVLFPGVPMNPSRSWGLPDENTADFNNAVSRKEAIYDLMPKILPGGSVAGSVLVPVGRAFTPTNFNNVKDALGERLFASVDEFLLQPKITASGGRKEIEPTSNDLLWPGLTRPQVVQRLGFFLTPNSRAPETNPFGLPKIAMWPIWGNASATIPTATEVQYRTVFDRMIARVSTLAGNEYFFRRQSSNSASEGTLYRNGNLLTMLTAMTDQPIPGFGLNGANFGTKYGENRDQILTEIFDYIRSTNLYDDTIALNALQSETPSVSGPPGGRLTAAAAGLASNTFTSVRSSKNAGDTGQIGSSTWPGHGQVVPTIRGQTRGMGRYGTISEVALHFIACAEATPLGTPTNPIVNRAGGVSAQKKTVASGDFPGVPADSPYQPQNWHSGKWTASNPADPAVKIPSVEIPRWYSNFPPLTAHVAKSTSDWYSKRYRNLTMPKRDDEDPVVPEGMDYRKVGFNTLPGNLHAAHPGFNPAYWNWTLPKDLPLPQGYKRVQASFEIEWFIPAAGWTIINPNFEIEVKIEGMEMRDDLDLIADADGLPVPGPRAGQMRKLFPNAHPPTSTNDPELYTVRPLYQTNSAWDMYMRGGTVSPRGFMQRKLVRGAPKDPLVPLTRPFTNSAMPADVAGEGGYTYIPGYTTVSSYAGANSYELISDFFDVKTDGTPMSFEGGTVTVKIKDFNAGSAAIPHQTFTFVFPKAEFPVPRLSVYTERPVATKRTDGSNYWDTRQMVPPPYWWSFNRDGALGRPASGFFDAADRAGATSDDHRKWLGPEMWEFGGRFRYIGDEVAWRADNNLNDGGDALRGNLAIREDVIRSLVIAHGDPRLIMAKQAVSTEFVPHRRYRDLGYPIAANMIYGNQNNAPFGTDRGGTTANQRFMVGATYPERWLPDIPTPTGAPATDTVHTAVANVRKYGDFDRGIVNMEDGAYINKPDEGNSFVTWMDTTQLQRAVPYFSHNWINWPGGGAYFSPNRQVASPGMFGSLPTGVKNSATGGLGTRQEAWRTLLFRPQTRVASTVDTVTGAGPHPGAPANLKWTSAQNGRQTLVPNYGIDPPDYLFMDFFWMPVVEPYAISEPGATSGKINMNYQMVPFRHVRRATGMHAAIKAEMINAVPLSDSGNYLTRPGSAPINRSESWFWKESEGKNWHRAIDATATLKMFDDRFRCGFNFISPAQICEMYLLPARGKVESAPAGVPPTNWGTTQSSVASAYTTFWNNSAVTAENLKERPYTNIYPKLTTRSNTFKVYLRAQSLKKARSTAPGSFDETKDSIVGEYRGSAVIERYLDQTALSALPASMRDYAAGNAATMMNVTTRKPLDAYHRFRILSQKSFD